MWFKISFITKFLLKAAIYLSLIVIVYFYQIIEVVNKYKENLTNIAHSEKIMENGIKPPFMTLCIGPRAKQEVFDKYKISKAALNEPNSIERNILTTLNKTLEKFFMEATFKLNTDFKLYMIWWTYDSEGWKDHKKQLSVGDVNTQKVENTTYHVKVKELPTFKEGMCYVLELKDSYILSQSLSLTVEKNEDIKMDYVKWTMTSDHDYLGVTTNRKVADAMPYKFTSKFGGIMNPKITTVQTLRNPLNMNCDYHPDYVSEQQCLVFEFFDQDFSPCPIKCLPIQMRGFRYVMSKVHSDISNCDKFDDEVCNGGPTLWKELDKRLEKCIKPCRFISYHHSRLEMKEIAVFKDNENEATFEFVNSDVILLEKEVLIYDFSDMIGTVGGSLGVAVGISFFTVISCCIDNFLELLKMFQTKTLFN